MPLGHAVNANLAMVSNFSVHPDRAEAIRRGQEGFEFFSYAVNALVAHDAVPGRSSLFADFQASRANATRRSSPPPRPPPATPTASARRTTSATTSAPSTTPASTR